MKKPLLKFFLLALFSLALLTIPIESRAQKFRVKVVRIVDGDTFTATNRDNLTLRFRLHGIDAPESDQPYGPEATEALEQMIDGKRVVVTVVSTDGWGRHIVKVKAGRIKDVGAQMLKQGMAWQFRRYDTSEHYRQLESKARRNRVGLWERKNPTPPWRWR